MLFHLVKKDFLLIKKYLLLMILIPIAIPILMMIQSSQLLGLSSFVMSVIFTVFMLYQYVLMAEMKYPKAETLLCATPYSRSLLVKARYVFLLLPFAYCSVAYNVLALLFSKIEYLTPSTYLIAMLISVILFGIYTPIQYKLGFEKTKYFFVLVIMGAPSLMVLLIKANIKLNFTGLSAMTIFVQYLISIVAIIAIIYISMNVSIKIYSKKELL
ncbi:ABC-2 transporter permease [Clostridium estertheticum]|uniref:ABC transporter permease n=1 Tax=Clostridium estertheticum subsp. estertheticum TaxID=1552 RepID=A0A1J0GI64_9CLOT|nr:ABC-2 transporter permease [Clostridium estertheticum]APC40590.1 ABC transporter permease [Clostridium estertheticum subsp. estertheticum]MBU3170808.1 ABC-2 transporter permease [Clostridium estertheticum]MBZ9617585.1 ABC-2 transporter permease [Clostridium estertheticum subsp. laramiense]WAG73261.1 ABC-2 transporter permease [Clostridium estertheticum]